MRQFNIYPDMDIYSEKERKQFNHDSINQCNKEKSLENLCNNSTFNQKECNYKNGSQEKIQNFPETQTTPSFGSQKDKKNYYIDEIPFDSSDKENFFIKNNNNKNRVKEDLNSNFSISLDIISKDVKNNINHDKVNYNLNCLGIVKKQEDCLNINNNLSPFQESFKNNYNVVEYVPDIFENLIKDSFQQNYNYNKIVSLQQQLTENYRKKIIDAIIQVNSMFKYSEKTLFLAINIFDRFLSIKELINSEYPLYGFTSLVVASKYSEIYAYPVGFMINYIGNIYTKSEVIKAEMDILHCLNYELTIPTCYDIYEILTYSQNFDKFSFYYGLFLLESFHLTMKCLNFSPIALAEAAVRFVLKYLKGIDFGYALIKENSWEELSNAVKEIYSFCSNITSDGYNVIIDKFKQESFMNISKML